MIKGLVNWIKNWFSKKPQPEIKLEEKEEVNILGNEPWENLDGWYYHDWKETLKYGGKLYVKIKKEETLIKNDIVQFGGWMWQVVSSSKSSGLCRIQRIFGKETANYGDTMTTSFGNLYYLYRDNTDIVLLLRQETLKNYKRFRHI